MYWKEDMKAWQMFTGKKYTNIRKIKKSVKKRQKRAGCEYETVWETLANTRDIVFNNPREEEEEREED